MRVAVFGLGYVGTVTAACLASRGHDVCGVDVDEQKVGAIMTGQCPVMEPGLGDLVATAVAAGSLTATVEPAEALAGADVSLVCVGTPSAPNGSTDLSFIERVTATITNTLGAGGSSGAGDSGNGAGGPCASETSARPFHTVAIRSTVPPGTLDTLVTPTLARAAVTVGTAMVPEFLREGSSVADFFDPPFTVIGTSDEASATALQALLAPPGEAVRIVSPRTAEALKYACNAFHATKVSFANEMARVFAPLGVDARELMELFVQDHRLNIAPAYLRPGGAFGGPCLPKDLRELLHLARMQSLDVPLVSGTLASNELLLAEIVNQVTSSDGRVVAVLGLSFKPSSDDLRESPNVRLSETLIGKGYELRIHDPVVNPAQLIGTNLRYVESALPHLRHLLADSARDALAGAHIAVVSSADAEVVGALLSLRPPRIIDLSGRLGVEVEGLAGYTGIGW